MSSSQYNMELRTAIPSKVTARIMQTECTLKFRKHLSYDGAQDNQVGKVMVSVQGRATLARYSSATAIVQGKDIRVYATGLAMLDYE